MGGKRPLAAVALGVVLVMLAACGPASQALSPVEVEPQPTSTGPQPFMAANPTVNTTFVISDVKLMVDGPAVAIPAGTRSEPAFELLVLHTNDVRGYTSPCG